MVRGEIGGFSASSYDVASTDMQFQSHVDFLPIITD
jgi:hypothetical protein